MKHSAPQNAASFTHSARTAMFFMDPDDADLSRAPFPVAVAADATTDDPLFAKIDALSDEDFVSDLESEHVANDEVDSIQNAWGFRAYEPTHKCTNKLLQQKWDQHVMQYHWQQLKKSKSTVDTESPKKYEHLASNKRRERMKFDSDTKICFENNNLVQRIKRHVISEGQYRFAEPALENPVVKKKGLNGPRKQILKEQMELENEIILQRLEASSPFYNKQHFSKERINTLLHLQNISRYPKRYVRQLRDAGVQFPRVAEKRRPSTARTDTATVILTSGLKNPRQSWDRARKIGIVTNPEPKESGSDPFQVPPRFAAKGPLVPRVAQLPPKKVIPLEALAPPKPAKSVPLVPRCALLAPRRPTTAPESDAVSKKAAKPSIYDVVDDSLKYRFEEEYPGDEDLIITNDSWEKVPVFKAIVRLNEEGHIEERQKDLRYNFADQDHERSLILGVPGFGSTFNYPHVVNYTVKIYVSSIDGDSNEERDEFIKHHLLPLRQYCASLGREFIWRDFKGNDAVVTDLHNFRKICLSELETCQKDSTSISSMVFFNNTHYGERGIPTNIDAAVFKKLLGQVKHMDFRHILASTGNVSAEDLVKRWYRLDDNWVPKRYILSRAEDVLCNIDSLDMRGVAVREWIYQNLQPLKQILRAAAVRLGRSGLVEPFVVQRFVQSDFQEEITRSVLQQFKRGGWQRSMLVVNTDNLPKIVGKNADQLDELSEMETFKSDGDVASQEEKMLQKITNPLLMSIPYENKVIRDIRNSQEDSDHGAAVNPILCSLKEKVKLLIGRHVLNHPYPNDVVLEIITHSKYLRSKARDHSHRGHLVDKIVSYMSREDKSPLPPFLLDGDASMGKTAVVGKSLQTFVKRLTEGAWSKLQTTKSPEGSTDLGEYPPNQVETNAAPEMQVVKPVLVARVCGLTPDSSNSRALVNSLAHQIFMAYDQPAERAEILSLESYRQAIRLARSEKPLIIILSKLDRLDLSCHSPLKLSWILDQIPPFVRIVFTVKTSTRPTSCHEIVASRVREMAPNVLYASAAADQRPPPSQGLLESCADDFFLNVGTIISPIAKSSIKRLLAIDGRKLRMDQEEAVRRAFAEAEPAHDGKHVPIRMLKQIYKISKDWKSSDQIGDFAFPKTIQEALDHELDVLEVSHGYFFTMTAMVLLIFSQDGLTVTEMEDLLSLDDSCLQEALKFSPSTLARMPSFKIAKFLHDISDWLIRRQACGGELFSISHDQEVVVCVKARYLSEIENTDRISCLLFHYFNGIDTAQEMTFNGVPGREYLPTRCVIDMPTRFAESDTCQKAFGDASVWNIRKIREYPKACLLSEKLEDLEYALKDLQFIVGFITTQSCDGAIEALISFLKFNSKEYRVRRPTIILRLSQSALTGDEPTNHQVSNALTGRLHVLIESILYFLIWNRRKISAAPKELRRSVLLDFLDRMPEQSLLKTILYPSFSRKDLGLNDWTSLKAIQTNGFGHLHCISMFRPIVSVQEPLIPKPTTKSNSSEDSEIDFSSFSRPNWTAAQKKNLKAASRDCELDGELDAPFWEQSHLRPSILLLQKNHTHCSVSNDWKFVAAGSSEGVVNIFDALTGFDVASLNTLGRITAMKFHPSSSDIMVIAVASSSASNRIIIWNISLCKITHELSGKVLGFSVPIVACGILREKDKKHRAPHLKVFGLGLNGVLTLWDLATDSIIKQFAPDPDDDKILATGSVGISQDGHFIAFGIRSLTLIDLTTFTHMWTLKLQSEKSALRNHVMTKIVFAKDSKAVYVLTSNWGLRGLKGPVVGESSVFHRFDIEAKITTLSWSLDAEVSDMSVSEGGDCAAFGNDAGILHIISLRSGKLLALECFAEPVVSVAFVSDRSHANEAINRKTNWAGQPSTEANFSRIAVGTSNRGVSLIEFDTSECGSIKSAVTLAKISKDGRYLAVIGGADLPERIFDTTGLFQSSAAGTALFKGPITSSLDDMPALVQKMRIIHAATSTPADHGASVYDRRLSITYPQGSGRVKNESSFSQSSADKSQKPFFDEPSNSSTLTVWSIETGRRVFRETCQGKLVWCDFDSRYGEDTTALITGDSTGTVAFWNWNAIGQIHEGSHHSIYKTAQKTQVETLSFKAVVMDDLNIIGYSWLADPGIVAVCFEGEERLAVHFWNSETGEKLRHVVCELASGPLLNRHNPFAKISLSWGVMADSLMRYCQIKTVFTAVTVRPACLVAGIDRFHISNDFHPSCSEKVRAVILETWGESAYTTYTASCQSTYDERVMVIAMQDEIMWISEETFVVKAKADKKHEEESDNGKEIPHRDSDTVRPSVLVAAAAATHKTRSQKSTSNLHNQSSLSLRHTVSEVTRSVTALNKSGSSKRSSFSLLEGQKTHRAESPSKSRQPRETVIKPRPESPLKESPADYCKTRIFKCIPNEVVIGLHHIQSYSADCILAATSNGTVALYDLKPAQARKSSAGGKTEDPVKLIGIWHAGGAISGMSCRVLACPETCYESDEDAYIRCKVAVWGMNGFATVLNMQFK
ncbi:hypothetical protein HDU78_000011 [Chytriomyces hyalinus]|nr:hypothetical protein HDU78_000011 [Chytriomyces hyalinus]